WPTVLKALLQALHPPDRAKSPTGKDDEETSELNRTAWTAREADAH
ncbi:hypothetical protein TNCV_2865691, partial [Trichonephila clavipes]